ncbi:uncharacterized protein LOC124385204 isoform X2 [Silurus meridionalis]|uniref:CAP-Gly domain-containing protein n=1 Tax=Silurus meridionalis TaxID=175797 RepID=A0A8T0BMZ3_SILME|nr:uncharacterized protein LOC124385204 isoform X2 [Silurus meridionalis]KAF7708711.1 hypothetical protein HF521_017768 [Silurus meridionalis]
MCHVVSSRLDSERPVELLEVFLESERKDTWEKSHHHEHSCTLHKRLLKAEGEIQDLKAQIAYQRASRETRLSELQTKQHDLRDRLNFEIVTRSLALHKTSDFTEMNERFRESEMEKRHSFEKKKHGWTSGLKKIHQLDVKILHDVAYSNSFKQGSFCTTPDSRSTSAMSVSTSVGLQRSATCHQRAFVPHSPMDLQIGHRVRILLPTGRISTGTLRYLGQPHGSADFCLGVELELSENTQQAGTYEGQCYFDCKPGHGAFVAFNKLLLAWE